MRIQYGGGSGSFSGRDGDEQRPIRNGRITIRSSGGSNANSIHMKIPAENLSDPQRQAKECPVCRNGSFPLVSGNIPPLSERFQMMPEKEEGFCLLRLPLQTARELGQLLLDAAYAEETETAEESESIPDTNMEETEEME